MFECYVTYFFMQNHNGLCLRGFTNNKGADQPAHPRNLISAFVLRSLESIISKLAPILASLCS